MRDLLFSNRSTPYLRKRFTRAPANSGQRVTNADIALLKRYDW